MMLPLVSVIIPCRNEAPYLARCLDSVLASDYPPERMEVLVAEGRSEDATRLVLERYAARDGRVRLVDNPEKITPFALNRAIRAARGEVIVRMDAHATVASDYVRLGVEHLASSGADNVGGNRRQHPQTPGPFAEPIRLVLSHPFGVGNAHYRTGAREPRFVDTVFGGCWRREVFARVGLFNEQLARSQDIEFNLRLRRAGGKILLVPDMVCDYYARSTFWKFCRHAWTDGIWSILPFAYTQGIPVRWRHLAPLAFVGSLAGSLAVAAAAPKLGWLSVAVAGPYLTVNLAASLQTAWKQRSASLALLLPLTFASFHLAYGSGSLWGAVRLAAILLARRVGFSPRGTSVSPGLTRG